MTAFISFVIFVVILAASIVLNLYLYINSLRLKKDIAYKNDENSILVLRLNDELNFKDLKNLEKNDDFVKFLSDSREMAFDYIEDIQKSLIKFDNDLKNISSLTGNKKEIIKMILDAYLPLKKMLPEEGE